MTIQNCMEGLASVIKTIDGYTGDNVSVSDNRILTAGHNKCAIIWRMPGHRRQDLTLGNPKTVQNTWMIGVDIYCLTSGDPQAVTTTLESECNLILDAITNYPNLNGTSGVIYAIGNMPEDMATAQVANTNYYRQPISTEVRELENVAALEGAGA